MDPDRATPSDEVVDLIRGIAMRAQRGVAQLNELLAHERDALQAHGPGGRHSANIAAVMLELVKVRNSLDPSAARAGYARRNQGGQVSQTRASRNFSRQSCRTVGRSGR